MLRLDLGSGARAQKCHLEEVTYKNDLLTKSTIASSTKFKVYLEASHAIRIVAYCSGNTD